MNERALNENVYWMLLQVAFRSKHGLMRLAERHDLSLVQLHTLCAMNPGEPLPMNAISCLLSCDASNITGIVDRLLTQKLIRRDEKPEDRRVKMITLTPRGQALREQIIEELQEYQLPEFERLSAAQRTQLQSLLSLLLQSPASPKS